VPKLRGRTLRFAQAALARANCSVGKIKRVASTSYGKGRIISTIPRAGTKHKWDTKVGLTVSAGRPRPKRRPKHRTG
jgi:beta-lactam-binding protein with PASTA domain